MNSLCPSTMRGNCAGKDCVYWMTNMEDTSASPTASASQLSSDTSSTEVVDNLHIYWIEGFDGDDIFISDHNLEKVNDMAEEMTLSVNRWLSVEGGVATLASGVTSKAILLSKESTPGNHSYTITLDNKAELAKLRKLIADEEGLEQKIKTY